jgi:hypothetical protein
MRAFLGTACFVFAFLASAASWAATVESGQGDLSINQGQGFAPVNGRVDANVGDSVMVSPNGSATVSYADGCQVNVQPGSVVTIAPLSPCASGSQAQDGGGFSWGAATMGVGFVALTGLAVYGITQAKSTTPSTPASP